MLQNQNLHASMKFSEAAHLDKPNVIQRKFFNQTRQRLRHLATMTRSVCGGVKVRFSNLRTPQQLSSMVEVSSCLWLLCSQSYWYVVQSGWNNEEAGLPPIYSTSPQINSQTVETWTHLGVPTGQSKHTAKLVLGWIKQANVNVLEWPSQSRNLNYHLFSLSFLNVSVLHVTCISDSFLSSETSLTIRCLIIRCQYVAQKGYSFFFPAI